MLRKCLATLTGLKTSAASFADDESVVRYPSANNLSDNEFDFNPPKRLQLRPNRNVEKTSVRAPAVLHRVRSEPNDLSCVLFDGRCPVKYSFVHGRFLVPELVR